MALNEKTDKELDQWIANLERINDDTRRSLYNELLEERIRRAETTHSLKVDRSIAHLTDAAIRQVCTTYGDLAKANGLEWSKARRQMDGPTGHLNRVADRCHTSRLPFLTALCVNQQDVDAGTLEGMALAGFVACARRLGYVFADEQAFHRDRRDECWQWGSKQIR